jgi:hypothetical protein
MPNLASLFILASLFSLSCAVMRPVRPMLMLKSHAVPNVQLAQVPMGRTCVTRIGSCEVSPRPINTRCYCDNEPGVVR